MQLRFATNLSVDQYIKGKAWKDAKLDHCPLHPNGGCKFAKHGTYSRKFPDGVQVARWYCWKGCTTFSMLPDCLSSRLPGTLIEVENVIKQIENSSSQEAAANNIRLDISLPSALRWMRLRLFLIRLTLNLLIELFPSLLKNCKPTFLSFKSVFSDEFVLPQLREFASQYLDVLPPPLGFGPRPGKKCKKNHFQHQTGTDPPKKTV